MEHPLLTLTLSSLTRQFGTNRGGLHPAEKRGLEIQCRHQVLGQLHPKFPASCAPKLPEASRLFFRAPGTRWIAVYRIVLYLHLQPCRGRGAAPQKKTTFVAQKNSETSPAPRRESPSKCPMAPARRPRSRVSFTAQHSLPPNLLTTIASQPSTSLPASALASSRPFSSNPSTSSRPASSNPARTPSAPP